MKKQTLVIVSSLLLILVFVLGGNFYLNQKSENIAFLARDNAETFVRDYSPTLGTDAAKVYLVEFLDPACGTCRAFYPFVKNLMAEYPDKIKLVIRYAPNHQNSDIIVKMLEAAKEQGKYWLALETTMRYQSSWAINHKSEPELLLPILAKAGIDIEKIKVDMNSPEIAQRIEQDLKDGKQLKVTKTPEFFVNGKPLPSFGSDQLKALVDAEVKSIYKP